MSKERSTLEHALELGGELAAALGLQLADHVLLRVVREALVEQEALGQVLLVVALEDVLLLQVAEEDHGLVEQLVDLGLGQALDALAQLVVDEEREVLGRARVQVDEVLEVGVDALPEELVVGERGAQEEVEALLQVQQRLDEDDRGLGAGRVLVPGRVRIRIGHL